MRKVPFLCLFSLLTLCVAGGSLFADEPQSLKSLLRELRSGAVVEVPDGTYTTAGCRVVEGVHGTAENPVTLRAAHRGKAVIVGEAGFALRDCEFVVLEGFVFHNDADQQSVQLLNCLQVRVTRNVFAPTERAVARHWEHWVTVDGAHSEGNRIDHNLFEHKTHRGSPVFVRGDDSALVCSQRDRVDHNHFRDVIYANGDNGHETIRTGGNDLGASGRSSFTIIEDNLLERCSGEDEIISLKSSDNIVRHNTFLNCRGAIDMRLGNRNVITDNLMMATEDGPAFGGVKLFGFEHRVEGNTFVGLTGHKHEAPFSLFPGMYDAPTTDQIGAKYDDDAAMPATRCRIANNTWVDCAPLQFGLEKDESKWLQFPDGCVFMNNRVVRTKAFVKPAVSVGHMRSIQAKDNVLYDAQAPPDGAAWASWFRWEKEKPMLVLPKALTAADTGPDAP